MAELKLSVLGKFDPENAVAIRADLSKHLRVSEPVFGGMKAADPPSFLQLLGDVTAWLPLKAAATIYLITLAKHAADATWKKLASTSKNKEAKPIIDVANTLATAVEREGRIVPIIIGLNIPDDYFGTAISIKSADPKEIASGLSSFVVRVEDISRAMKAEVEAGRAPLGAATIELQKDGSLLICWVSQSDFRRHELKIPNTK